MIRGPKRKKLGHFGFSTSKLRSNGPANCVWAAIRARPAIRVGAGDARPAGNPCSAYCRRLARQNAFGQQSAFHQQNSNNASPANDFPPANPLTTSKPTSRQQARSPNAPSHSGTMPTGEQAGPDGTPPKALNLFRWLASNTHLLGCSGIITRSSHSKGFGLDRAEPAR